MIHGTIVGNDPPTSDKYQIRFTNLDQDVDKPIGWSSHTPAFG